MRAPLIPSESLDLVHLDRETLDARLRYLAAQASDDWVDQSLASHENVNLQGMGLLGAMGFSLINERARQGTFAQVTDRLSCIRLARPHGLSLTSAEIATVSGYFATPGAVAAPKRIMLPISPQRIRLQSGQGLWQLVGSANYEISAGSSQSVALVLEQAETQVATTASSDIADQIIVLGQYPIVESSVQVVASNGTYSRVRADDGLPYKTFLEMAGLTLGFIVLIDNVGRGYIYFGDDINGKIPKGDITVTYKTGGGADSQVTAGSTWTVLDAIYDEDGGQTSVVFVNTAASAGGLDQMSVEEARVRVPARLRVRERSVNEDDVEATAETVGGIVQSALMTSEDSADIAEDEGKLYLVALGAQYTDSLYYPPAAPTTAQKTAVAAALASGGSAPTVMGTSVQVLDAVFLTVDIDVRIYKSTGTSAAAARAAIVKALQMHFAVADSVRRPLFEVDFGFRLKAADGTVNSQMPWSDIFEVIAATSVVDKIPPGSNNLLLNGTQDSVTLRREEFPTLGTVTIRDMDNAGVEI